MIAFIRSIWNIFWSAILHPCTHTTIDLNTGKIIPPEEFLETDDFPTQENDEKTEKYVIVFHTENGMVIYADKNGDTYESQAEAFATSILLLGNAEMGNTTQIEIVPVRLSCTN